MNRPSRIIAAVTAFTALVAVMAHPAPAPPLPPGAAQSSAATAEPFEGQIKPFVATYCVECHNAKKAEAELDLTRYQSAAQVGEAFRQWEHVVTFLEKQDMPPADAPRQPLTAERAAVVRAIHDVLQSEARRVAGDPGTVLPRRLTNAEYNYTIRDLTGVDIRPADSFPVDPASGEGFSNTGEALVISPGLFKKQYAAAQHVADHLLLTPTGLRFAPFPVVTLADRVKYYEQTIIRFYDEHDVDYAQYLTAAWLYRHRPAADQARSIDEWVKRPETQTRFAELGITKPLSPKYLRTLFDALEVAPADDQFYLGAIRRRWREMSPPAIPSTRKPDPKTLNIPPAGAIAALADEIRRISTLLCAKETPAIVSNAGNGPVQHIERRNRTAARRNTFDPEFIADHRRLHVTYRRLAEQPEVTIHLRAELDKPAREPAYVIVRQMALSNQSADEYKPGGIRPGDKNKFVLRDLLLEHAPDEWKKLRPGKHPLGHVIAEDCVVLSTETPISIRVPTAPLGKRDEIRFFVEAELDREHSPAGVSVLVGAADHADEAPKPGDRLIPTEGPQAEALRASSEAFCRVFPNRFVYVDETRGLSAGFHLIEGFFRDDQPLVKLVLDDAKRRQLDQLWDELYFGTGIVEKMLRGFVFFERSERGFLKHRDFDRFKEEDPDLVKDATLAEFERVYLERSGIVGSAGAGVPNGPQSPGYPIRRFFGEIRNGLKRREAQFAAARPIYRRQLKALAEQAYRRPLTPAELAKLTAFYEETCARPEFGIDPAVRGVLTSLLVSPHFLCRIDVPPEGDGVKPMADVALASRLSYLIWASMPDDELLALARAGKLNDEATLRAQTRRMLRDPKAAGFALEFFGQWLRYRDFLTAESVDRRVFPSFNDELKQAMFEEPTRLITHLIQTDRPVTDLLFGDSTFVNAPLAAHYGIPLHKAATAGRGPGTNGPARETVDRAPDAADDDWLEITGLRQYGRGGVLGMGVFLTAHSQPQRTSPVKRGFWVVHKILGEHIPAPPANVAVLPAKETDAHQTVRQLLAAHTEVDTCARCHRRFDPIGLSMEGFDPIGRSRTKDLAGRPIDNVVDLPTGGKARGVPEFVEYLRTSRYDDFIDTLGRKFLGYALGRSVELSDQELLEQLKANLRRDGDRFSTLFETVVCSPQFRNQRGRDFSFARYRAEARGETER